MSEKYLRAIVVAVIVLCAGVNVRAEGVYEAWVARYNDPYGGEDEAYALELDVNGNIYVTGISYSGYGHDICTIKYFPNGDTAWMRRFQYGMFHGGDTQDLYDMEVDGAGNILVVGQTGYRGMITIKYAPNGDTMWTRQYTSPTIYYSDYPTDLTTDSDGFVYVTGSADSTGDGSESDFVTLKYKPNGDLVWTRIYSGLCDSWDQPEAIAVDQDGNVYVAGWSYCNICSPGCDYYEDNVTVKYSPAGDVMWISTYEGPGNDVDGARALALDDSGYVYVAGFIYDTVSLYDCATMKYSPSGDQLWAKIYNGPVATWAITRAMAIDDNRNVYVTGEYGAYRFTLKYSSSGELLWARPMGGNAIILDNTNSAYIAGTDRISHDEQGDYIVAKFSPNGDSLWAKTYDGPAHSWDFAFDLDVDGAGNVYVTGLSVDTGYTIPDYLTIKYSPCLKSGNLNGDDKTNIVDVVYLANVVLKSWPLPNPICLADVNGDSLITLADVIYLANHVFKRGPAPVQAGACCD